MRVGFIGAGRMGRPMVARLVEAGRRAPPAGPLPPPRSARLPPCITPDSANPITASATASLDPRSRC